MGGGRVCLNGLGPGPSRLLVKTRPTPKTSGVGDKGKEKYGVPNF